MIRARLPPGHPRLLLVAGCAAPKSAWPWAPAGHDGTCSGGRLKEPVQDVRLVTGPAPAGDPGAVARCKPR
eukprot:5253403-Alexandrium_andersonii.AAC.1